MLTVRSTINISSQTVPPIIPVVQGDTGRAILFTLADFTIPAGAAATYYVQKPSGEAVYNNATIDGNNILVELTAQSIIEKGDNYGQVRITVGEEVVTSFDFILLVKEFRGIDAVQSLTEMNIFDKAVEQASEAIDEVKTDALEAIDDAKDEAIEEVTSNFDLKLDASSTKGVQNQVITQAINTVNNAIGDLSGETVTPTATNNYGIGGSVGQVIETWATTDYWHGIYTVTAGNMYGITTVSDFPQQIVVWFTNSSNVILEIHKAFGTDHVEMVCTAPTGATKLFVMSYGYDAYHGTVQKVEPLAETVSNLKDDSYKTNADLDSVSSVAIHGYTRNLINYETCKKDTYISYQDGEEHYINSTYATDYIAVDGGATYTANIKDQCAWYDASYAFISGLVRLDGTVQAPNNAKYFRTTIHSEYFSQKSIVFVRGDSIGTNPKPVITHASDYTTVLTVGNGKMYGSLKSALNDCANPSEYNRYLIELYNDYSVPVTEEEKADNSFVGLFVPNWVKVKGIGDRRQITVYLGLGASTSEEAKNRISTFNLQQNSELENLTIIGENCKYAVHDDFEAITDVERHIRNCKVISRNTLSHVAWGSGYRSGLTWYFDDCVFINEESTGHPFASHNNRGFEKPAKLVFTNCRFEGGTDSGARFGSINTGYTNIINQILFYGNKIGKIYLTETDPTVYGTGIKVTVSGFGNTCGNNDVVISNTDGVDYSSYVDLI